MFFFFCQRKLQIQFQIIWKTCQKWLGLIIFSKVQSFLLFFWHRSIYIKAEFFIWHAAYFHLPPYCHGDSPSKSQAIEIRGGICGNFHAAGLSYLPYSFSAGMGWKMLPYHKTLARPQGVHWKKKVLKVNRVRVIWLCCYGNCTNQSSICHLVYRIEKRSR